MNIRDKELLKQYYSKWCREEYPSFEELTDEDLFYLKASIGYSSWLLNKAATDLGKAIIISTSHYTSKIKNFKMPFWGRKS